MSPFTYEQQIKRDIESYVNEYKRLLDQLTELRSKLNKPNLDRYTIQKLEKKYNRTIAYAVTHVTNMHEALQCMKTLTNNLAKRVKNNIITCETIKTCTGSALLAKLTKVIMPISSRIISVFLEMDKGVFVHISQYRELINMLETALNDIETDVRRQLLTDTSSKRQFTQQQQARQKALERSSTSAMSIEKPSGGP
jgi:hypothetical protein